AKALPADGRGGETLSWNRSCRILQSASQYSYDGRCMLASTTVSAVMLTILRTVADGVKMCTALATPSKMGPSVTPPPDDDLSRLNAMFAASTVGMMRRFACP